MILLIFGRFIQFTLLLVTMRMATTFLAPDQMGRIAIATGYISFFALLFLNPVGMFMNRRLLHWDEAGLARSYIYYFYIYLLLVTIVSGLIMLIAKLYLVKGILIDYPLILIICGNLFFATLNQVSAAYLNIMGRRGLFMSLTLALNVLSLIMAVTLTIYFSPSANFWLTGLLVGQVLIGFLGAFIFDKNLKSTESQLVSVISMAKVKSLIKYAWPVCLAAVCFWIQSQGYRYQMEQILGLKELGLFFSGYLISTGIVAGFDSIISAYFQPIFYKDLTKENDRQYAWLRYARVSVPSLLFTGFFIASIAPELTAIILGSEYQSASIYVIFGAFAESSRVIAGIYGLAAHASMDTKKLLIPNFISAILCIFSLWLLVPIFSSSGVGYALIVSSLFFWASSAYYSKKLYKLSLSISDFKYSFLYGLLLLLLIPLVRSLYSGPYGFLEILITLSLAGAYFLIIQLKLASVGGKIIFTK